jgi:methionyl-tRNA formyltransferase
MRVILAGQKSFGLAAYEMLLEEGHEVVGVWSPATSSGVFPDLMDSLTAKAFYDELWTPPQERVPELVADWAADGRHGVDLFVCAHSHDFIGRRSRQATRLGGIGYHPSLLPRHRGRDAVEWTVRMGDPIAGGSVYWLTDQVDGGPVAAQDWCFVPRWETNYGNLSIMDAGERVSALWREQLFPMGIRLLRKTLQDLDAGLIIEIPQDEQHATWEPSIGRPPLFRPELPQIGSVRGFTHITKRE